MCNIHANVVHTSLIETSHPQYFDENLQTQIQNEEFSMNILFTTYFNVTQNYFAPLKDKMIPGKSNSENKLMNFLTSFEFSRFMMDLYSSFEKCCG